MMWTVWKTLELHGFNVCSHFLFGWVCCKCTQWQQQSLCAYSGTGKEKDILILIFTAATIWGRTATLEKWTFKKSDWFQGTRDQLKLLLQPHPTPPLSHPSPTTITTATPWKKQKKENKANTSGWATRRGRWIQTQEFAELKQRRASVDIINHHTLGNTGRHKQLYFVASHKVQILC